MINSGNKCVTIHIKDLTVKTIIGTQSWERAKKQKIIINISYKYNAAPAIAKDDLTAAVDYKKMEESILHTVSSSQYNLLETLVDQILEIIMGYDKITETRVCVDKPGALGFAKSVSAERRKIRD